MFAMGWRELLLVSLVLIVSTSTSDSNIRVKQTSEGKGRHTFKLSVKASFVLKLKLNC